jgi:hypothetical protein
MLMKVQVSSRSRRDKLVSGREREKEKERERELVNVKEVFLKKTFAES